MATSIIKNSPGKLYTLSKTAGNSTTMTLTVERASSGYSVFFAGRVGINGSSGADYGIIVFGENNDVFLKHASSVSLSVSRSGNTLAFTFPSAYSALMFMSILPLS